MLKVELSTDKNTSQELLPKKFQIKILLNDYETPEDDLAVASCRHAAYS
jgi:hypothetical protein